MLILCTDIGKWTLENKNDTPHKVLGGIICPCHDKYEKKTLIESRHRVPMAKAAIQDYPWIKLSPWEVEQDGWRRTRLSLDEHKKLINDYVQGKSSAKPEWLPDDVSKEDLKDVKIYFICGADLLESFNIPDLWADEDVNVFCGFF